jgi:hypothetical protein
MSDPPRHFRPTRPPVAGGPTITLMRGEPVPHHLTDGYAPHANRKHHGLFLVIQPADPSDTPTWLWDEPTGWTIGSAPPGLAFLPPDFDDSDLELAGYTRIGEIRA